MHDIFHSVPQTSVTVEGITHVEHFIPAVIIHIGNTEIMCLRTICTCLPLLHKIAVFVGIGDIVAVEGFVIIAVLHPADEGGLHAVKIADLHHARLGTCFDLIIRNGGRILHCTGHAVNNCNCLTIGDAVGIYISITERYAVRNAEHDFCVAVAVNVIDGRTVPHADINGCRTRFDLVAVHAVRSHVDRPEVGAVIEVGFKLLGFLITAVDQIVIRTVTVEITDPDEMHCAAVPDRNGIVCTCPLICRQGEAAVRVLFHAVVDGPDGVGVVLGEVGCGIGEIRAACEDFGVHPDGFAVRGTVDIEAHIRFIGRKQTPADKRRIARSHSSYASVKPFHHAAAGKCPDAIINLRCSRFLMLISYTSRKAVNSCKDIILHELYIRCIKYAAFVEITKLLLDG